MKIVIIGSNGQLGKALCDVYPEAITIDRDGLDITDVDAVNAFDWSGIAVILNAAAYTNVDGAETDEGRVQAWLANTTGVANLARIANNIDATLIHVSSEYVFDGTKSDHKEDEPFNPLSVYGASKAAGDIAASLANKSYIVRTSWVVGSGNNFVRTMHSLAGRGISPKVVNDQLGRLTFADTLADGIKHLVDNKAAYGVYNLSNSGPVSSWYDIATEVYQLSGSKEAVIGISTAEYFADKPTAAKRPLNSDLNLSKIEAIGFIPSAWQDKLKEYCNKIGGE
jgi:dTDP-4-dehydrorhamnose 3,5-epimerase/reductase